MSSEHYTRCPHCKATFKVNDDQLAAAGGQVRCGACMNVFDALAYLIQDEGTKRPSADTVSDEKERQDKNNSDDDSALENDYDVGLIQDDPEEDDESEMAVELSDSILELDKKGARSSSLFSDSSGDDEALQEDTDEAWAKKVLEEEELESDDEHRKTIDGRIEPTFSKPSKQAPKPSTLSKQEFEPEFQPEAETESRGAELDIPDDLDTPTSGVEKIDFYYQEPETVRARSLMSRILIGFGSIVLILLLLAQVAWFHYEKLAKYPAAKEAFAIACEHIGCKLPELVDLNKIRSHNLVVRSHPTTANALIIDVVLTNEADFPQDFPRLAMYFSDINEKVIAQQIISPEDYLSEEVLANGVMPSNEPIYVSIELEDPGKQAVNYKIRFFPSKANSDG